MDVSFDGISDDDLALIWKVLRDKVEAANDAGDDEEREACHLALMSACAETGRRTDAWIAAKQATYSPSAPSDPCCQEPEA